MYPQSAPGKPPLRYAASLVESGIATQKDRDAARAVLSMTPKASTQCFGFRFSDGVVNLCPTPQNLVAPSHPLSLLAFQCVVAVSF